MHRRAVRMLVGGVEVDVPLGAFSSGQFAKYDGSSGTLIGASTAAGDFVGPASSTSGDLVSFNGTSGKLGQDSGIPAANVVQGPASAVTGDVVSFNGTSGKLVADSGKLASALVTGPGAAIGNHVTKFSGTSGKVIADAGYDADIVITNFDNAATIGNIPVFHFSQTDIGDSGVSIASVSRFRAVCASTADQTLSGAGSNTQTALTNLSFALPAAGTYFFEFELQTATNTGSTTQDYSVSYSGTTTGGIVNMMFAASAASITTATSTTFTTAGTVSGTRATITTVFPVTIRGTITVSTAGTLRLNGATGNTADALVVKARSGGLCEQQ